VAQLEDALAGLEASKAGLYRLSAGGTAVGTGLNAPEGCSAAIAAEIARLTGLPFVTAPNKCAAQDSLDAAVAFAGSQGSFELNAMRPTLINKMLHSVRILGDACEKLLTFSVDGTELNRAKTDAMVSQSLMLITALSPVISCDKASHTAHMANDEGTTLREAAIKSGFMDSRYHLGFFAGSRVALELTPEDANSAARYKKIVADPEGIDRLMVECFLNAHAARRDLARSRRHR